MIILRLRAQTVVGFTHFNSEISFSWITTHVGIIPEGKVEDKYMMMSYSLEPNPMTALMEDDL